MIYIIMFANMFLSPSLSVFFFCDLNWLRLRLFNRIGEFQSRIKIVIISIIFCLVLQKILFIIVFCTLVFFSRLNFNLLCVCAQFFPPVCLLSFSSISKNTIDLTALQINGANEANELNYKLQNGHRL